MHLGKTRLLFLVILLEGYVVLATELLAIRLLIPFVGSGTETISILISAVLLPLAVGYHAGGSAFAIHYRKARARGKRPLSVRQMLMRNLLTAGFILAFGLSYIFLELFFGLLSAAGIHHRLPQAAAYSLIFLVTPVFLLGQTVPLVSNYFSRRRLSEITGTMLFFSTTGSFFGSVFSTIVLMMTIGVHLTAVLTLALLMALIPLLARRRLNFDLALAGLVVMIAASLNAPGIFASLNIVSDNAYNTVRIRDIPEEEARIFEANRSSSSKIAAQKRHLFPYVRFIEEHFLSPIAQASHPRDILIIGAGGFAMGLEDAHNRYTFVDIDPSLRQVAEEHFLKQPLTPNKTFVAASARAFVHTSAKQFDLIVIDTYTNLYAVPMETVTREFLADVKARLKPGGFVVANVISTATFRDRFSYRYENTFASVFPHYSRQIVGKFNAWADISVPTNNILYIYRNDPAADSGVYTDDRNTFSVDR